MSIDGGFVFWPLNSDPLFRLVGTFSPALLPNGTAFLHRTTGSWRWT